MYLIILTYKKPLEDVDNHLSEHRFFLQDHYETGNFIFSGGRKPRTGGIILCKANNVDDVNEIIQRDPFHIYDIADYEILEFTPSMYADGFERYLD